MIMLGPTIVPFQLSTWVPMSTWTAKANQTLIANEPGVYYKAVYSTVRRREKDIFGLSESEKGLYLEQQVPRDIYTVTYLSNKLL